MNGLIYRSMKEKDVKTVSELEELCFRTPWSYDSLFGELSNSVAHYIVAAEGEKIVGYAGSWIMFDEAHITNIAVAPEYRCRGIGRGLILKLMETAIGLGASRMTLEVRETNHHAQRLYASLGFTYAGTRKRYYSDTGENALILWNDCITDTFEKNGAEGSEASAAGENKCLSNIKEDR